MEGEGLCNARSLSSCETSCLVKTLYTIYSLGSLLGSTALCKTLEGTFPLLISPEISKFIKSLPEQHLELISRCIFFIFQSKRLFSKITRRNKCVHKLPGEKCLFFVRIDPTFSPTNILDICLAINFYCQLSAEAS